MRSPYDCYRCGTELRWPGTCSACKRKREEEKAEWIEAHTEREDDRDE